MNKFKKVLLGALSVLTLGLFVATGVNVTAASPTYSSDYKTATFNSSGFEGLKQATYTNSTLGDIIDFTGFTFEGKRSAIFIPIPSNGVGSLRVFSSRTNNDRPVYLFDSDYNITSTGIKMHGSSTDSTTNIANFSSNNYIEIGNSNYIGIVNSDNNSRNITSLIITLTTGTYPGATTKTFTLNYDANGGTGTMAADTNTEALDATSSTFNIMTNTFTREGYNFVGWSTIEGATSTNVTGDTYTITSGTEATLYAVWEQDTSDINFTLNFDANGGTSGATTSITSGNLPYTTTSHNFTISVDATPTREGYDFLGWATTNTATTAGYSAGDTYNATSLTSTLYAVWEKTITPISDEYLFYLTANSLPNNSRFEFSNCSTSDSKGSVTYNGITSSNCIKMESKTTIIFKLNKNMKVSFVFVENASLTIDGTAYSSSTSNVYTTILSSGNHSITKNGAVNLFFISFENLLSDNVSVEMHTQYNNATAASADKLRLIGYVDGVTDVADVSSITINATVTRSGDSKVATLSYSIKKLFQSFNSDYTATPGRYYAVVVIENIDDLIADTNVYTLSTLSITVTFTDNSSVTSTGFTSFKIGE